MLMDELEPRTPDAIPLRHLLWGLLGIGAVLSVLQLLLYVRGGGVWIEALLAWTDGSRVANQMVRWQLALNGWGFAGFVAYLVIDTALFLPLYWLVMWRAWALWLPPRTPEGGHLKLATWRGVGFTLPLLLVAADLVENAAALHHQELDLLLGMALCATLTFGLWVRVPLLGTWAEAAHESPLWLQVGLLGACVLLAGALAALWWPHAPEADSLSLQLASAAHALKFALLALWLLATAGLAVHRRHLAAGYAVPA
ncbi:hypothetical protein [Inhella proteolytica]|uniref:Uncharacterized protein n=1 Tax=Inhella proteolytica TaxID=2795029 RepID=A0A931J2K1_9BURK|nr:hypothetical protein [Inhella proteolytica]MBH9576553.1 hypothetical protein [Inhella proteolytica]